MQNFIYEYYQDQTNVHIDENNSFLIKKSDDAANNLEALYFYSTQKMAEIDTCFFSGGENYRPKQKFIHLTVPRFPDTNNVFHITLDYVHKDDPTQEAKIHVFYSVLGRQTDYHVQLSTANMPETKRYLSREEIDIYAVMYACENELKLIEKFAQDCLKNKNDYSEQLNRLKASLFSTSQEISLSLYSPTLADFNAFFDQLSQARDCCKTLVNYGYKQFEKYLKCYELELQNYNEAISLIHASIRVVSEPATEENQSDVTQHQSKKQQKNKPAKNNKKASKKEQKKANEKEVSAKDNEVFISFLRDYQNHVEQLSLKEKELKQRILKLCEEANFLELEELFRLNSDEFHDSIDEETALLIRNQCFEKINCGSDRIVKDKAKQVLQINRFFYQNFPLYALKLKSSLTTCHYKLGSAIFLTPLNAFCMNYPYLFEFFFQDPTVIHHGLIYDHNGTEFYLNLLQGVIACICNPSSNWVYLKHNVEIEHFIPLIIGHILKEKISLSSTKIVNKALTSKFSNVSKIKKATVVERPRQDMSFFKAKYYQSLLQLVDDTQEVPPAVINTLSKNIEYFVNNQVDAEGCGLILKFIEEFLQLFQNIGDNDQESKNTIIKRMDRFLPSLQRTLNWIMLIVPIERLLLYFQTFLALGRRYDMIDDRSYRNLLESQSEQGLFQHFEINVSKNAQGMSDIFQIELNLMISNFIGQINAQLSGVSRSKLHQFMESHVSQAEKSTQKEHPDQAEYFSHIQVAYFVYTKTLAIKNLSEHHVLFKYYLALMRVLQNSGVEKDTQLAIIGALLDKASRLIPHEIMVELYKTQEVIDLMNHEQRFVSLVSPKI